MSEATPFAFFYTMNMRRTSHTGECIEQKRRKKRTYTWPLIYQPIYAVFILTTASNSIEVFRLYVLRHTLRFQCDENKPVHFEIRFWKRFRVRYICSCKIRHMVQFILAIHILRLNEKRKFTEFSLAHTAIAPNSNSLKKLCAILKRIPVYKWIHYTILPTYEDIENCTEHGT